MEPRKTPKRDTKQYVEARQEITPQLGPKTFYEELGVELKDRLDVFMLQLLSGKFRSSKKSMPLAEENFKKVREYVEAGNAYEVANHLFKAIFHLPHTKEGLIRLLEEAIWLSKKDPD